MQKQDSISPWKQRSNPSLWQRRVNADQTDIHPVPVHLVISHLTPAKRGTPNFSINSLQLSGVLGFAFVCLPPKGFSSSFFFKFFLFLFLFFTLFAGNSGRFTWVKPVLNWANVCSPEHTSDTSTNYDSFLN